MWNFRGSDAYHEIHEILYATKFNTRTVHQLGQMTWMIWVMELGHFLSGSLGFLVLSVQVKLWPKIY